MIKRRRGRPARTSHEQVAGVALRLFARQGFDATTVEEIAAEAGVSRRTIFRYYPSKNDMVWGDFDWVLDRLRSALASTAADEPLMDAITRAVLISNHYEPEQLPELRIRLTLITSVPALQAHSMIRYADWRGVVSDFVAKRLKLGRGDLIPEAIGWMTLGASLAAFVRWVDNPSDDLELNLARSYALLDRRVDSVAAAGRASATRALGNP
jgi:TetR/AcrR family transcriptional regulator, regulator of mycofactocin system